MGTDNIIIKIADRSDAAVIADLSRKTFYDSFAPFNTKENMDKFMAEQFSREALMQELGMAGNIFLIALLDNTAVGYVRMRKSENPPELGNVPAIEIARIYVEQTVIGKGVGAKLLKQCIEIARARNEKIVWLGVWEHNPRAIAFYSKWGFEKFGSHDFMLGDDRQTDWYMKKNL